MLGVKRMPRPLSESRKPESRRKTAVLRGMRLRPIDSPPVSPDSPALAGRGRGPEGHFLVRYSGVAGDRVGAGDAGGESGGEKEVEIAVEYRTGVRGLDPRAPLLDHLL